MHAGPKQLVRRYIRQMAVSRKAALGTNDHEALATGFETAEDIVAFLHHNAGYDSTREEGSIDNKGFFLHMRTVKVAEPEGLI